VSRPFDFLNNSIGKDIYVKLKEDIEIRGKLVAFDAHMNTVLEEAEELHDGKPTKKVGKLILRGDNIIYISPSS
jgi:small nuclear ribonucleoprotein